ncbi:MAG: 3'-5' exonuclease [Planctomycetaceae bacterium]|nr:3'-5' exonuclease [Planctomycetaceae bacterium]
MATGIATRQIEDTPVAVIDFETTGLTPGYDRVVEASVVRIDPGEKPRLVFDTLVNPSRPMAATEIHGISDADVANAPRFHDIAGEMLAATKDCVIAAYNVYFDIKFLAFELSNAGVRHDPPHFCLMYLRSMLGLGSRCKLEVACRQHGVDYSASHVAAHDALAAGQLFCNYLPEIRQQNVRTYDELAALKTYKFNNSFDHEPFPDPTAFGLQRFDAVVSRAGFRVSIDPVRQAIAGYWDTLKTVLADLEITDEELAYVLAERRRGGLRPEQIRVLHARAFASAISQFASDEWVDDREVRRLRRLHHCLAKLGWAPGQ